MEHLQVQVELVVMHGSSEIKDSSYIAASPYPGSDSTE